MFRAIKDNILSGNSIYKIYRKYHENELKDLDAERKKIFKLKKDIRKKMRIMRPYTKRKMYLIWLAISKTVKHMKNLYFHTDIDRLGRL